MNRTPFGAFLINDEIAFSTTKEYTEYVSLLLDTWYYYRGDAAENESLSKVGEIRLGKGPLHADRATTDFLRITVGALLDAMDGFLRIETISIIAKKKLDDVQYLSKSLTFLDSSENYDQASELYKFSTFLQSLHLYIVRISFTYTLNCYVIDREYKSFRKWLPHAGELRFSAEYSSGTIHAYPASRIMLSPLGVQGLGEWRCELFCNIYSLFKDNNIMVLSKARRHWRLYRHESNYLQGSSSLDYIATFPEFTTSSHSNRLAPINVPLLSKAIMRWSALLGNEFEWATAL
jgi:hypothetical protein